VDYLSCGAELCGVTTSQSSMAKRAVPLLAGASGVAIAAVLASHGPKLTSADAATSGGGGGKAPSSVEIHCSPISPTCARYKAFFAWQKVPTKVVDTLPLGRDGPPRVVADGVDVADLPGLVAQLRPVQSTGTSVALESAVAEEKQWVKWADDTLIPHLFVNVYRSPNESAQAIDTAVIRGDYNIVYSTLLRHIGTYYMYSNAKMAKRKMEVCTKH